jgi:hypothetical protein
MRWTLIGLVELTVVVSGCGPATGQTGSTGSLASSASFIPMSEKFTTANALPDGGPDLSSAVTVRLTGFPQSCGSSAVPDGGRAMVLEMRPQNLAPLVGSYTVGARCDPEIAACAYGVDPGFFQAAAGSVTIDNAGSGFVSGAYSLTLANSEEVLSGRFFAPYCPP